MNNELTISAEVYCGECDRRLEFSQADADGGGAHIWVDPCSTCLAVSYEEGKEDAEKDEREDNLVLSV